MFNVKSVSEVFEIISSSFSECFLEKEGISLRNAAGRITADEVLAIEDVPAFNRSSMDGYAVISSDTFGSSDAIPAVLKLVDEVEMGVTPKFTLEKGQAAYIPTGGELPKGADAVVMIEYTENYNDGFIYINKPSAPGNNVVFKGDDVKAGSSVLKANIKLKPQDIGALAAMGYTEVSVKRKLKVGIISTGNEIVDIGEEIFGARVRDINSYTLYSGLLNYGCEAVLYGIVKDDYNEIKDRVLKALDECDVVLISGGSSVGTRDETYNVINSLGEPGVLVHGIAVKPGKPTIIGKVKGKAVLGLPGHPASAYVIFRIFVYHLLDVMSGLSDKQYNKTMAVLKCNYPSNNGREEFVPVKLESVGGKTIACPLFGKSGLITLLSSADGFVWVERGVEGLSEQQEVEVILF